MKTIRMTTAQALVAFLKNQYVEIDGVEQRFVKGVFTIFGHGNVVGLGQALEQDGEFIIHQGCNEQGMAHSAMGFAKQRHRKQIYAVTSSVGPGAANMVTAAATATANRIPVLFLPGDTFATRQPDPVLQQVEHFHDLTLSTNDSFRAVSKYWDRVSRPEQLMTAMLNAMRVLTDPADTGAVTVCLPQDVQGEAWEFPAHFFNKRIHRIERRPATEAMLQDAVSLIKRKKKPLLICGGGVRYSEAHQAFRAFAEKFNIPFAETQAGKSAIPYHHPLNLGGVGTTGCLAANLIAKEADLIIGVGTRFTDFTTASKWLFQGDGVETLTINVAGFDAMKLDATPVVADAKAALEALVERLEAEGYRSGYDNEVTHARQAWDDELQRLWAIEYTGHDFVPEVAGQLDDRLAEYIEAHGGSLIQTQVLGVLDQSLDDDAIIVGAAGSLPGDLQRMWRPKTANTYHMEYGYSCMGYEVNAALGVKIACPDQEVYALLGDGSFMMLHSELQTSIQENRKINLILLDNMGFGCINNLQMGFGMGSFGTENRARHPDTGRLNGNLVPVDFAKIGEGYGCKTYSVRTVEELTAALADAKQQTVSTLIDIKVLPKTMTNGYESFWRVGNAQEADMSSVLDATAAMESELERARRY
ncbi:3D-(3,5/4)-trihydroxycyclohexane-1,2-dione acylhydrolase (decyclizing) [Photobacterium sagamiensis]|uniref:3D-(3,5/4)-trihydroxycyclohexane-1,2-dione acylhydrolase (decyclizing) n=1 Tax=Photobacterium sagamiensis TaxID=2910241 RepID=UPI003D12BC61